jgi:hypothetical protein
MWIDISPANHIPITEFILELGKQNKIPNIYYEKPYVIKEIYYKIYDEATKDFFFNLPLNNWLLEKWINIYWSNFLDKLLKKVGIYDFEDNKDIIKSIFEDNELKSICEFLDLEMPSDNKETNNKLSFASLIQTIKNTVHRIG